jgi:hypothetical protein
MTHLQICKASKFQKFAFQSQQFQIRKLIAWTIEFSSKWKKPIQTKSGCCFVRSFSPDQTLKTLAQNVFYICQKNGNLPHLLSHQLNEIYCRLCPNKKALKIWQSRFSVCQITIVKTKLPTTKNKCRNTTLEINCCWFSSWRHLTKKKLSKKALNHPVCWHLTGSTNSVRLKCFIFCGLFYDIYVPVMNFHSF